MEVIDILVILGVVAIIIIQYIAKAFKSGSIMPNQVPQKEEPSDTSISIETEATPLEEIPIEKQTKKQNRVVASPKTKDDCPKKEAPKKKTVSLDNLDEAKRAFIYSEIFNRKY